MANPEHLNILNQGMEAWNAWRKDHPIRWPAMAGPSWADYGRLQFIETDSTIPDLTGVDLSQRILRGYDLSAVRLCRANLVGTDLQETDVAGSLLRNSILSGARLPGANFSHAELQGADLTGADLRGTALSNANLTQANLQGVTGHQGRFREANFSRANFSGGHFQRADFTGGNLFRANLRNAWFEHANLSGVNLGQANLDNTRLQETILGDTDLKDAKLSNCKFLGPCTIDHRTFKKTPNLPLLFLRGCGLSDAYITYIPSLFQGPPLQYYSCFISYSTKDQLFTERLFADLQNNGVRCWYAPEEMKGGEKLFDQIDSAIRVHDKLLLVLSEHSLKSEWVLTEIRRCRKAEKREDRRKLFPIRLVNMETIQGWECFDADNGKDLAAEIREFFIPDFSTWKEHDSYKKAFDRLIRALKESAEQEQATSEQRSR